MHRTLLFVPHDIFGIPIFGLGWLLAGIVIYCVVNFLLARNDPEKKANFLNTLPVVGIALVMIVFVFPGVELKRVDGQPLGMAVRGYGVMLMLAVLSAVALAGYRAKQKGLSSDTIFAAAPWLLILGIFGARLFYVIEYRDDFPTESLSGWLGSIIDFTRGGIVVYGSLIGGFFGLIIFCRRNDVSFFRMADIIIPCVFLGLFFGRIGCLMNGCCYGGRCQPSATALEFPRGSPVYDDQAVSGDLVGLKVDWPKDTKLELKDRVGGVTEVRPDSLADEAGIEVGDRITLVRIRPLPEEADMSLAVSDTSQLGVRITTEAATHQWSASDLPDEALPVVPAQLFSSGLGLLVAVVLILLTPWITTEGILLGIGFSIYAIVRFGLEIIRSDEPGQFGTSLTISQWVSVIVLIASISLIAYQLKFGGRNANEADA